MSLDLLAIEEFPIKHEVVGMMVPQLFCKDHVQIGRLNVYAIGVYKGVT